MQAYRNYWIVTAILLLAIVYAADAGGFAWFWEKFPGMEIRAASAGILLVFLYAYFYVGHRAALRLYREAKALRIMVKVLNITIEKDDSDEKIGKRKVAAVRKLLNWIPHYYQKYWQHSAVVNAIQDLSGRVQTMQQTGTRESINRAQFQDDFENSLSDQTDLLEWFRTFLFFIGILGTVVGIVLALAASAQDLDGTPELAKLFTDNIIKGMGLAYITSVFGMGGAIILFCLTLFNGVVENAIARRFRRSMFRVVFPVIHSPVFGFKGGQHHDATKKE